MSTIIVAGALANKVGNGGGAWERMSWVVGLRRLGFDVWFIEQIDRTYFATAVDWFRQVTDWFGLGHHSVLIEIESKETIGVSWADLLHVAASAELLVNLSGHLTQAALLTSVRRRAYIDVDPGFTQFWHADPSTPFEVGGHDFYYTIGENIGLPNCAIPTGGIPWERIRQPVVLDDWPMVQPDTLERITTIGSWRGAYGPVYVGDHKYGLKAHEFRRFAALPQRFEGEKLVWEAALDIHSADAKDRATLEDNGWRIVDPRMVAGDPAAFRRYIQGSALEWSVAQGLYVETNSGWISDRTVRYLASGRPAVVQDTGNRIPTGQGLLTFQSMDEAEAAVRNVLRNYSEHCRAARALAADYFDSDKVLGRFLEDVGIHP